MARVFNAFEAPDYSQQGVDEFFKYIETDAMADRLKTGQLFMVVCTVGGTLAGVLAYRPWHVSLLFVEEAFQRQGIARQLFQRMTERAKEQGTEIITVNSSPYAVEIYQRLGFASTDEEQTVNGIRFTPMKLSL